MHHSHHRKILGIILAVGFLAACGSGQETGQSLPPSTQNGNPQSSTSPIDPLLEKLCAAALRCDDTLNIFSCLEATNGEEGMQLWDDFGLAGEENQLTSNQVREKIRNGEIDLDISLRDQCLEDLVEICDNEGEKLSIDTYDNLENLIPEDGPCPQVIR